MENKGNEFGPFQRKAEGAIRRVWGDGETMPAPVTAALTITAVALAAVLSTCDNLADRDCPSALLPCTPVKVDEGK